MTSPVKTSGNAGAVPASSPSASGIDATALWRELLEKWGGETPPSVEAMRLLRRTIFLEYDCVKDPSQVATSATIAQLLGERDASQPQPTASWMALRTWAKNNGFDADILTDHLQREEARAAKTQPAPSPDVPTVAPVADSYLDGLRPIQRRSLTVADPPPSVTPITLRDYQEEAVKAVTNTVRNGRDRALIVMPTGSGKTVAFAELVGRLVAENTKLQRYWQAGEPISTMSRFFRTTRNFLAKWERPGAVLVITHREEIMEQNAAWIGEVVGPANVGIVKGDRREWDRPVVVASTQTLVQDGTDLSRFGLVVLDEAHHYVPGNEWFEPLKKMGFFDADGNIAWNWPRVLVGVTATPDRLTGRPLNTTFGTDGLVYEVDISTLIEKGYLLTPYGIEVRLEVPGASDPVDALRKARPEEKARIIAEIFYDRLHHGNAFQRTIIFVSSKEEVRIITDELNKAGIRAVGVTEETPEGERRGIRVDYKAGKYDALVNVQIATEGFDDPGTEAVIIARSTESRALTVQMIGRSLRPDPAHPERRQTLIVDLGQNLTRHNVGADVEELYLAGQDHLKRVNGPSPDGPVIPPPPPVDPSPLATVTGVEVEDLGRLVSGQIRTKFSMALRRLLPTPEAVQKIAFRMGVASDVIFAHWNGLSIPDNLKDVNDLAAEVGDPREELADVWAWDKVAEMDVKEPLSADISPARADLARHLRFALWRLYGGNTTSVAGTKAETTRMWLKGVFGFLSKSRVGAAIWESVAKRMLNNFDVSGRMNEALRLLNAVLEEINYPPFEKEMLSMSEKEVFVLRLKQFAKRLGRSPTTGEVHAEPGMASSTTYKNRFGSFNEALDAAGLEVNVEHTNRIREEFLDDLKSLAERLGRSPTGEEVNAEPGMASRESYRREFGSFNKALDAAGLAPRAKCTHVKNRTREELLDDLKSLAERLGRSPTTGEVHAEPGMASREFYSRKFGSFNKALDAAGLATRTPGCHNKGFTTVELLAWPVIGPADLAIKAYRAIPKAAQTTLRGGLVFLLGDIGSELVRGNWDHLKKLSIGGIAADYAALSVGGGIGNLTVKQLFSNPAIARVTPNILKGIAGRAIPLFSALAVLERTRNGKINWGQLPISMGNVLTASTAVQGAVTLFGKSQGFRRAGEALRVVTTAGKATLVGAVAMSVAEFTIIKALGDIESSIIEARQMDAVKNGMAGALVRHQHLMERLRSGEDITIREILDVEDELASYKHEIDELLQAEGKEISKGFEAEKKHVEDIHQKKIISTTNCHPSPLPEWVLEKRKTAQLAGLEKEENETLAEVSKRRGEAVAFYPLPTNVEELPSYELPPDGEPLLWDTDKKEYYKSTLAGDWPSLSAQLARYVDDTNKELVVYLERHAKELAVTHF